MQRFLIMGLPRSGTTYLMTLLNSHPHVYCSGEQFNPHAIVGITPEDRVDTLEGVMARDHDPIGFFEGFFRRHATPDRHRLGFKFMIGHNVRVLDHIAHSPDIKLIYVHRDNKLAQVSSLIKALETQDWATTEPTIPQPGHIKAGPRPISHRWHEYETYDHLFRPWFEALPHDRLTVEYRELFAPGFNARICDFLGIAPVPGMRSPLVKQNLNTIAERFSRPDLIVHYFTGLGLEHWLHDEVPAPSGGSGPGESGPGARRSGE